MSAKESNIESNLRRLAEIKSKNPQTTHVYFKGTRKSDPHATVDVPMRDADFTIRQWPMCELLSSNEEMAADVAELFREPVQEVEPPVGSGESGDPVTEPAVEVPPKPSEKKVSKRKPRATHRSGKKA